MNNENYNNYKQINNNNLYYSYNNKNIHQFENIQHATNTNFT